MTSRRSGGRRALSLAASILLAGSTVGCSALDFLGLGEDEVKLEGERIPVMVFEQELEADPTVADVPVLLPRPYINRDWPQAGGSSAHAIHHLELPLSVTSVWNADIGEASDDDIRIVAQPVKAENLVFTLDAETLVRAFDVRTGGLVWERDLALEDEDDGIFGGGLAWEEGLLFATTGYGGVIAMDAATGEVLWEHRIESPIRAAPTVSGGRLFVVTVDNQLVALASSDGRELWSYRAIEELAGLLGGAAPAVSGATVVAPFTSGELIAFRVQDGRELWNDSLGGLRRTDPLADLSHIRALPVIDRGLVLAISHSEFMTATDQRGGARVWEETLGGTEMPWVAGDFIFLVTNDGQLMCLIRSTGAIRWVQQLPRFEDQEDLEDPITWYGPLLAGDRLIVTGSEGTTVAISPYDGEVLGQLALPGRPAVAPIIADRTLFFLTEDAELIAFR